MKHAATGRVEWPTIVLIFACYALWFALAFGGDTLPPLIWISSVAAITTLYWSLVHEVVHGHPTTIRWVNSALVWLPLGWVYAYGRFREEHLTHHATGELTDPFDDPESWYLAQTGFGRLSRMSCWLLTANNTLLGRMAIGPLIVGWRMVKGDLRSISGGGNRARTVAWQWALHGAGVAVLIGLLAGNSGVPVWWYALAAYFSISILLIRTFLEHQASENVGERTVIIEDRGPLAFLFLFNNLHVVHHTRPGLAWYHLPGFYRRHRNQFIVRNKGYIYSSYWQVFRRYFLVPKEPVAHPFAH
jgi:fatty acid desaturase